MNEPYRYGHHRSLKTWEDVSKHFEKYNKLPKGGRTHIKKSKGLTKNQKLKKLKTSKLKKLVKSTKK